MINFHKLKIRKFHRIQFNFFKKESQPQPNTQVFVIWSVLWQLLTIHRPQPLALQSFLLHKCRVKNQCNKNKFLVNEDDLLKAQTNKQPSMPLSSAEIKLCDIQGYDHLHSNNDTF